MHAQGPLENQSRKQNRQFFTFFTLFLILGIISGVSSVVLIDASNNENLNTDSINSISDEIERSKLDRYGIMEIYPTIEDGREFFSHWDEGGFRVLKIMERDSYNFV